MRHLEGQKAVQFGDSGPALEHGRGLVLATKRAGALLSGPRGSLALGKRVGLWSYGWPQGAAAIKVVWTMLRHSRVLVTGHWTSSKETGCIVWPSALRAKTTPSSADAVVT